MSLWYKFVVIKSQGEGFLVWFYGFLARLRSEFWWFTRPGSPGLSFDAYIITSRSNALRFQPNPCRVSLITNQLKTQRRNQKPWMQKLAITSMEIEPSSKPSWLGVQWHSRKARKFSPRFSRFKKVSLTPRGNQDLADPFCRKRHCCRGSYTGRLQFLHLCSRRQNLPIRLRNPKHSTSTHKRADTCHHKCDERSHHPNRDDAHTGGDVLCEEVDRCNVRDL
jgi:hypothetical protein